MASAADDRGGHGRCGGWGRRLPRARLGCHGHGGGCHPLIQPRRPNPVRDLGRPRASKPRRGDNGEVHRVCHGLTSAPRTASGDRLGSAWRDSYWATAQQATRAWQRASLAGLGTCHLPFGDFDASTAAAINAFDLVVHSWDLAQAVGSEIGLDEDPCGLSLGIARVLVTPQARAAGHYGAALPAATDAPASARLLALTGRASPRPW